MPSAVNGNSNAKPLQLPHVCREQTAQVANGPNTKMLQPYPFSYNLVARPKSPERSHITPVT